MFINIYIYIGLLSGCVFCTLILLYKCTHAQFHRAYNIYNMYNVYIKMSQKSVGHVFLPMQPQRCVSYDTAAPHRIFIIIIYYLPSGVVVKFDRLYLNTYSRYALYNTRIICISHHSPPYILNMRHHCRHFFVNSQLQFIMWV